MLFVLKNLGQILKEQNSTVSMTISIIIAFKEASIEKMSALFAENLQFKLLIEIQVDVK